MINKAFLKQIGTQMKELINRIEQVDFKKTGASYKKISVSFTELDNLRAKAVRVDLSSWEKENEGSRYIYIIQATDEVDIEKCHQQYENAKSNNINNRAFARLNENANSKVFYVGSSRSLGNRIEQHLGFGHQGTFSLQIIHWSSGISGELTITIYRFPENLGQDVIQAIEDGLWEKHKPMFGRRGSR